MGQPTIPPGTYDCVVRAVEVRRRKKDGAWVLEVVVKAIHKDHELVVYQDLADTAQIFAFDLTPEQYRSLTKFASRLELDAEGSKVPAALALLAENAEVIQASVTHGGGHQQIVLSRDSGVGSVLVADAERGTALARAEVPGAPSPDIVDVDLTETAWIPHGDMHYDQWEAAGRELQRMGRAWQWWVGDWLNYGERKYGEKYAQAVETTGWANQTLRNVSYVARQIEPSRRRDDLEWSHHAEVASLTPEQQDDMLSIAADFGLTVREVRSRVKEGEPTAEKVECPTCGSKVKPEVLP